MNVAYKDPTYLDIDESIDSIHKMIDEHTAKLFLMANKIMLKRMRGTKIDPEEEEKIQDLQRIFKSMQSTYMSMVKMGRIVKTENPKLGADILKGVREQQSSIGNIVQKLDGAAK